MPTVLQFRRGTTSQNNSFTGTAGELSVDTTLDTIRVHDGSTAGGVELTQNVAAQTLTNKTISGSSNTLSNIGNSSLTNSGITVSDGSTSTATALGGTITFAGTANEVEVGESSGTITVGLPDDVTVGGTLIVTGNLTVSGTTTTVNTETINLADNQIVLNSNETGTPSQNGGIEIERGTSTNKTLVWNETDDKWTVGSETFVAGTFEGALTGAITGNADTATTLATARNIAGQSFNGSAAITIASTDLSDTSSIALLTTTQTLTNKTLTTPVISSISNTGTLTLPTSTDTLVGKATTDTLTNKTFDADNNTLSNVGDEELKSGIDAAKIGDGSISNTEFQYLNNLSSNIQSQLDNKASIAFAVAFG